MQDLERYVANLPKGREIVLDPWAEGKVDYPAIARDWTAEWDQSVKRDAQRFIARQDAERTTPVGDQVLRELAEATIEGQCVVLARQMDRKLYQQVNQILETLGGKWNRKKKAHVFEQDPEDLIEGVVLTGRVVKPQNYGFFPTPVPLARELVSLADLRPGMNCLEPSAGEGAIADLLAPIVGSTNLLTIELQPRNAEILRKKGHRVVEGDFLQYMDGDFERIVMNPPFSVQNARQADIDHVEHAWKRLLPGGRLVAVMSASVTFRDNRKTERFRGFAKEYGEISENAPEAFKASGTLVRTVNVVLDKPL